jgi:polyisoprenoid-binding protein YceI
VDPAQLSSARGNVAAQVATLRTGNDTRDEHLRGDHWLDAGQFPAATFAVTAVEGAEALTANQPAELRVRGRFTLHGVTKNIVATAGVRWMPITDELRRTPGITGDVIRIRASFDVLLTDYGVSVPQIVRLKVANEIAVSVDLRAIAQPVAAASN